MRDKGGWQIFGLDYNWLCSINEHENKINFMYHLMYNVIHKMIYVS